MNQRTKYTPSQPPRNPTPSNHRQDRRPRHGQADNRPPRPLHLLVTQLPAHIPNQMPDAIEAMKRKREGSRELSGHLQRDGPSAKRRGHAGRLQMPAEQRRDQIRGAEEVEAPAEHRAGDPVQRRAVPRDLRLVDGQVRRHGPVQALLDEDVVRVGGADRRCCCGSGGERKGGMS